MSVRIVLHLDGLDLPKEALGTVSSDLGGGQLDRTHGVDTLTVEAASEETSVAAVLAVVDKLNKRIDGAVVRRVSPGIVSVPEIAAATGIDREVVRKWTKWEEFPPMFDNLRGHQMWLWREIIDWVEKEAKITLASRPPNAQLERELGQALGLKVVQ